MDVFDLLLGWVGNGADLGAVRARRFSVETVRDARRELLSRLTAGLHYERIKTHLVARLCACSYLDLSASDLLAWRFEDYVSMLAKIATQKDAAPPSLMVSACILDGILRANVPLQLRVGWGRRGMGGMFDAERISLAELCMACGWCAWWPRLLLCWQVLDWTHDTAHHIVSWSLADRRFGQADEALSASYSLGTGLYPVGAGFVVHIDPTHAYQGLSARHVQVMAHGREFAARCINYGLRINPVRHLVLQWTLGCAHLEGSTNAFSSLMSDLIRCLSSQQGVLGQEAEHILSALISTGSDDGDGLLDLTAAHPYNYIVGPSPHAGCLADRLADLCGRVCKCCASCIEAEPARAQRMSRLHALAFGRMNAIRRHRAFLLPTLSCFRFLPVREMLPHIAAYALCPLSTSAELDLPRNTISTRHTPPAPKATTDPPPSPTNSCSIA
jgi:hypothetical protein